MRARLAIAAAALAAVITVALLIYWKGRLEGAARQRARTEVAQVQAAVAGLEADGARTTVERIDVVVRQREAAAAAVADLTATALKAEDADAPLDPDRAARLRAADRELCLASPDLSGCAADSDAG